MPPLRLEPSRPRTPGRRPRLLRPQFHVGSAHVRPVPVRRPPRPVLAALGPVPPACAYEHRRHALELHGLGFVGPIGEHRQDRVEIEAARRPPFIMPLEDRSEVLFGRLGKLPERQLLALQPLRPLRLDACHSCRLSLRGPVPDTNNTTCRIFVKPKIRWARAIRAAGPLGPLLPLTGLTPGPPPSWPSWRPPSSPAAPPPSRGSPASGSSGRAWACPAAWTPCPDPPSPPSAMACAPWR